MANYNAAVESHLERTVTYGRMDFPVWWNLTARACDKADLAEELRRLADQLDAEPEIAVEDLVGKWWRQ